MKNNNRSKKPKFGTNLIGGFITILLAVLLIPTALLVGLKIGILKDSSLEGLAKELNISEFTAELVPEIIHNELDSEEIDSEAILNCLPEGMMEDFSDEVISCISNGDEIRPEFFEEYYGEIAQNTSQEITAFLVDELVAQAGSDAYITKEQISKIEVLQDYSKTYETELDNVIASYGDGNGISVSDISNNETIHNEISKHLEPVIQTTLQTTLEENIDEINKQLTGNDEIAEFNTYLETATKSVSMFTVLFCVLCVMLMIVTFINYRGFLNYAFRNNGVALLLSGLFITAVGLIANFGTTQITNMISHEMADNSTMSDMVEKIVVHAMNTIFLPIRNIGFGFLIAAIVMLILAKMIKAAKQSRSYDEYE